MIGFVLSNAFDADDEALTGPASIDLSHLSFERIPKTRQESRRVAPSKAAESFNDDRSCQATNALKMAAFRMPLPVVL
jgi:hypothetical protein